MHTLNSKLSGSSQSRSLVSYLCAVTFVIVAVVGGVNALVDPLGEWFGALPPLTKTTRQVRVEQIEAYEPIKTIVLGSSRSMQISSAHLGDPGASGFYNASVYSGMANDYVATVRYVLSHPKHKTLERVVIGVEVCSFHGSREIDDRLARNESLSTHLQKQRLEQLAWGWKRFEKLFSYETFKLSKRSITYALTEYPEPPEVYLDDGTIDYVAWDEQLARGEYDLKSAVDKSITEYKLRHSGFDHIGVGHKASLIELAKLLKERDIELIVFTTPIHPRVEKVLRDRTAYSQTSEELVAFLAEASKEHEFKFVDTFELATFGGEAELFYDGVHVRPENLERLVKFVMER